MFKIGIALLVATGLFAGASWPGGEPPQAGTQADEGKVTDYLFKDGSSVRGEVLAVEGNRVRLRIIVSGGSVESWKPIEEFSDLSQYRIKRDQHPEGDIAARLALARWCVEKGLLQQGREQLREGSALLDETDASAEQRSAFVNQALPIVEEALRSLVRQGKTAEARSGLSSLLIKNADRLSDEQKARLTDALDQELAARRIAKAEVKQAAADEKTTEQRKKALAPVEKRLEQAQKELKDGLLNSKYSSKASASFERATSQFEAVVKSAESLAKSSSNDAVLAGELASLEAEATAGWKQALLASASLKLVRGQYNSAMGTVNRILASVPNDPQALQMRARIEVAASEWDIWRR